MNIVKGSDSLQEARKILRKDLNKKIEKKYDSVANWVKKKKHPLGKNFTQL